MKKYPTPKLFVPTQEDLDRVGKEVAKNLSSNVKVMAGENEFIGERETTAQDWLDMDLKAQSGSIWTDEKTEIPESEIKEYPIPEDPPFLLKPDEPVYGAEDAEKEE